MKQFEIKVAYTAIDGRTDKEASVKETYFLTGETFGDAESRIYSFLEPVIGGEFDVLAIKLVNYAYYLPSNDVAKWYRCKTKFEAIDDKNGKPVFITDLSLIPAGDVVAARELLLETLQPTNVEYDIISIVESNIKDVFLD